MHGSQLNRLKQENKDTQHYIHRLSKQGKSSLAYKVAKKQAFVEARIAEYENQYK